MSDTETFVQEVPSRAAITFKERFQVLPDQPLPAFDSALTSAFAARDSRTSHQKLVALICTTDAPPRLDFLTALRALDRPTLMRAVTWGPIDWPAAGRRRFCIIYRHPGEPIVDPASGLCRAIPEKELIQSVIAPMTATFNELSRVGLMHRAIRADNLFFADSGRVAVLGDAAAGPPGAMQPLMYETIENGMAHPFGRAEGLLADDLYAMGVTLVVLLLGRNPVAGMDDSEVLRDKITKGSYAALVREERLPSNTREAVRGLLIDDPFERWTLEDLEQFLGGRRLMPKQAKLARRASRPFAVGEEQYHTCREVAHALTTNWLLAKSAIRDGDLETWLRRGLGDQDAAEAVASALGRQGTADMKAAPVTPGDSDVARICMALDPPAPLRYKGFAAMLDSFGPALLETYREEGGAVRFAEIILNGLPTFWLAMQPDKSERDLTTARRLDALHVPLKSAAFGMGVERCLYDLNPDLHCLSPLVERDYVVRIEDLLPALEASAGMTTAAASVPMDRHLAAFIAARFHRDAEGMITAIGGGHDKTQMALASLRVFAHMQWRLGPAHLPALSQWFAGLLPSVAETFRSHGLRDKVRARIGQVARTGSLIELLNAVDDPGERQADAARFNAAVAEYAAAEAEIAHLMKRGEHRTVLAQYTGQRVSAAISLFVAVLTTIAVLYLHGW